MPTSQDFQRVARVVKRELYGRQLGFKIYPRERFVTELNVGSGVHVGEDIWESLGTAFLQEGLFVFRGSTKPGRMALSEFSAAGRQWPTF